MRAGRHPSTRGEVANLLNWRSEALELLGPDAALVPASELEPGDLLARYDSPTGHICLAVVLRIGPDSAAGVRPILTEEGEFRLPRTVPVVRSRLLQP